MTQTRTLRRALGPAARVGCLLAVAVGLSACVVRPGGYMPPGGGIVTPAPDPVAQQVQRRTFSEPRVGGRWLDVCYAHGGCRERQAVTAFCRQQGYQRAERHTARVAPFGHTSVRIGDQSLCRNVAGNCHRVVRVTCSRMV